jgi:PAS domain S-box-containing protein
MASDCKPPAASRDEAAVVQLDTAKTALAGRQIPGRELLNVLPAAIYVTDAEGRITFYNEAAADFAGRAPALGDRWCVTWKLFHPDGTRLPPEDSPIAIALRERRPVWGTDAVAERPDGTRRAFASYPTPLFDEAGELLGAVNMLVDITERKDAETRQRLLSNEADHRANNLLSIVQAMVRMAEGPSVRELKQTLEGRIKALAHAHVLLSQSRWTGADLQHLVSEEIAPYLGGGAPRVWFSGPMLTLEPNVAQSVSLILHELAANAARHGALSGDGQVMIDWRFGPSQDLVLRWREVGGPSVAAAPGAGLGLGLIEKTASYLKAAVRFDWRSEGLAFELSVPVVLLVAQPDVSAV